MRLTLITIVGFIASFSAFAVDADYEALKILTKNCAPCHQAADHPGALFLNQARLSEPETVALIRRLLETDQMPPPLAHKSFRKSKDGKVLLTWLKNKAKAVTPSPTP